jgi:hypothetical protein
MSNPYRNALAELYAASQLYTGLNPAAADVCPAELVRRLMEAMAASAALLAQPEPPELTDEVLLQMLFDNYREDIEFLCDTEEEAHLMIRSHVKFAHAAIAAAADCARTLLDQPELPELTDEEIDDWSGECSDLTRANDSAPDCPIWAPLGWAPPHP